MALTSMDQVIAGLSGASGFRVHRSYPTNGLNVSQSGTRRISTWTFQSFWKPISPAAATVCDGTTPGAPRLIAPAGGNSLYLVRHSSNGGTSGLLRLWDRLAHVGGLLGNSAALQSFSLTLPTRATGRTDVQMFIEIYVNIGATPTTLTVTYTNQSGVAGQTTTFAVYASMNNLAFEDIPLASGDTGVQSVQSVQLGVSTGTVGNFGITLAVPIEPLAVLPRSSGDGVGVTLDALRTACPVVHPNACLFHSMLSVGSPVNRWAWSMNFAEAPT